MHSDCFACVAHRLSVMWERVSKYNSRTTDLLPGGVVVLGEPLLQPGDLRLGVEADSHPGLGNHERVAAAAVVVVGGAHWRPLVERR